ncbi:hypothetical protein [Streptomyces sp. MP131-18]|uniref:hypothetical protein n=1 Tax=Streptomyces sp. MP131-18 TaxID=1857892 RepID=UPI00097C2CA4|nr:hypothetical protein [Streptomyces sp. MP131-18]ONK14055.1 hypothetical protein STBA_48340 [Streptomyces sp. MP131-18]
MTNEGDHGVLRAVRRIPVLLRIAAVGPVAAVAGLLLWAVWGDPGQRLRLLAGCLGLAAAALLVLLGHRLAVGRVDPADAARAVLDGPGGGARSGALPAVVPSGRRLRLWTGAATLALSGWGFGLFFLAWGDPVPPGKLAEIHRAGGVVADVPITGVADTDRNEGQARGNRSPWMDSWTQTLEVELTDEAGRAERVDIRTRSSHLRQAGDTIKVVYAPSDTGLGAYIGDDSRVFTRSFHVNFEGYQADLPRLADGRTLSGYELLIWAVPWALSCALMAGSWFGLGNSRPVTGPSDTVRALRGTFTRGRVTGDGGSVAFHPHGPALRNVSPALDGRAAWVLWDVAKAREFPKSRRADAVAVLVLDNGWAVHGEVRFAPAEDPAAAGVPAGEARARTDEARRVRPWAPWTLWPLTVSFGAFACYAVVLVCSGLLFTDVLSGFPRFLAALVGACCLYAAARRHFPHRREPWPP